MHYTKWVWWFAYRPVRDEHGRLRWLRLLVRRRYTDHGLHDRWVWQYRVPTEYDMLEHALASAAQRFREYEALHAAKGTRDGDTKARRNAEIAEWLEQIVRGEA